MKVGYFLFGVASFLLAATSVKAQEKAVAGITPLLETYCPQETDDTYLSDTPVAGITVLLEYQEDIPIYDIALSRELQIYTYMTCQEYAVDYKLVIGLMQVENRKANPDAIHHNTNGTKDVGVMQINSCNHKWLRERLGELNFFNPKDNIRAGIFMLSDLQYQYKLKEKHALLMAYNMGPGRAKTLLRNGVYSSSYSRKVAQEMSDLKLK